MAASADALLFQAKGDSLSHPVTAATTIYKGEMISVVDGYAVSLTDGSRFDGHAVAQANNSAGSAGDIAVQVYAGRYMLEIALSGMTIDMVGAYVYAVDNNTYTLAPMETPLGKVVQYVSTTKAIVEFDTNISRNVMGAGVNGIFEPFRVCPVGLAAPTVLGGGWINTLVDGGGDAAQVLSVIKASRGKAYNSGIIITTNDAENDGTNLQLSGEPFLLDDVDKPVFFGAKVMMSEATQSDMALGLCITDGAVLAGVTDGIFWAKADGAAAAELQVEKDSTATASSGAATVVTATAITLGFLYNGTNVVPYVNGVAGTGLAITNLPNDEGLAPVIEILAGTTAATSLTVYFMDAYQIVG